MIIITTNRVLFQEMAGGGRWAVEAVLHFIIIFIMSSLSYYHIHEDHDDRHIHDDYDDHQNPDEYDDDDRWLASTPAPPSPLSLSSAPTLFSKGLHPLTPPFSYASSSTQHPHELVDDTELLTSLASRLVNSHPPPFNCPHHPHSHCCYC